MMPKQMLKTYFGYDEFKTGQEAVIESILNRRDALAVMPTGGGKSVCYQIPALLMPGITIVISPLIALMKDQVDGLSQAGIAATQITSALDPDQTRNRLDEIAQGRYKIIYIAPERLQSAAFHQAISDQTVSFVAIDEAHCVSQWGHDFRPSYTAIAKWIGGLNQRPVVAAFTATATREVRADIIVLLRLMDPLVQISGFDRPNLHFSVLRGVNKISAIQEYIDGRLNDPGIIYAATRKEVDRLYQILTESGVKAGRYHAGLEDDARSRTQEDFLNDRVSVMVATNAFGLGIDKSNVRWVIHHNMPRHLEAYYQEAGRAGRDGLAGDCLLLFSPSDVNTQKYLIENSELTPEKKTMEYTRLQSMIDYCHTSRCLRQFMLEYFGEIAPNECASCSSCCGDYVLTDMTLEAQMILSCVKRMGERFGINTVADVLRGASNRRVAQYGFAALTTYGLMKDYKTSAITDLIHLLAAEGLLAVTDGQYPVLRLTEQSYPVLRKQQEVVIRRPKPKPAATVSDRDLFQILKSLRLDIARDAEIPPYVVFHDSTLREMSRTMPQDERAMMAVPGMGTVKYERFGRRFLEAIQDYATEA